MKKCLCQSLTHLFFGNIFLVNQCLFGIDSSDNSSPDEQSEDDANVNEFPKGMKSELLESSPLSAEVSFSSILSSLTEIFSDVFSIYKYILIILGNISPKHERITKMIMLLITTKTINLSIKFHQTRKSKKLKHYCQK